MTEAAGHNTGRQQQTSLKLTKIPLLNHRLYIKMADRVQLPLTRPLVAHKPLPVLVCRYKINVSQDGLSHFSSFLSCSFLSSVWVQLAIDTIKGASALAGTQYHGSASSYYCTSPEQDGSTRIRTFWSQWEEVDMWQPSLLRSTA